MSDSAQDRTLPATARKISKAREEGQVARSRDLGHFAALMAASLALVAVGTLNGFILPFALGAMLLALSKKDVIGGYRHPEWMTAAGLLVAAATLWMGVSTLWKMVTE